ncbi:MAG: hypothetical protein KKB51_12365 [Candidatus Riflebacteria bacterium]|nr:hypothetical protein [Candidatus Riflebacteria bacterium]
MDNARWIVVLSVIFSMMAVLTLLNRYATRLSPATTVTGEENAGSVKHVTAVNKPAVVKRSSGREIPRFGQISFPKPAAHTLMIDQPRDFEKMRESIEVEGCIIK